MIVTLIFSACAIWLFFPDPKISLVKDRSHRWKKLERWLLSPIQQILCALVGIVTWLIFHQLLVAFIFAAVAYGVQIKLAFPHRKRNDMLVAQMPTTLTLLAAVVESGLPMRMALAHVISVTENPTSDLLQSVLGHIGVGRSESQAWNELGSHDIWGAVARDLARSSSSGAAICEILHVHAEQSQQAAADHMQMKARSIGVYAIIPLVSCFLPAFILVGVIPIIASIFQNFLHRV